MQNQAAYSLQYLSPPSMIGGHQKRHVTWPHRLRELLPGKRAKDFGLAPSNLSEGQWCLLTPPPSSDSPTPVPLLLAQVTPVKLAPFTAYDRSVASWSIDHPDQSASWTERSYISSHHPDGFRLARSTMPSRAVPHRLPQSRLAHFRKVSGPPIPSKSPRHRDRQLRSYNTFDQILRSFENIPADRTVNSLNTANVADMTDMTDVSSLGPMRSPSAVDMEQSVADSSRVFSSTALHRHKRKPVPYLLDPKSPSEMLDQSASFDSIRHSRLAAPPEASVRGSRPLPITPPSKRQWAPLRTPSRHSQAKATPSRPAQADDTLDDLFDDVIGMLDSRKLSEGLPLDSPVASPLAQRAATPGCSSASLRSTKSTALPTLPLSRTSTYRARLTPAESPAPVVSPSRKSLATPRRFPPVPPTPNFISSGRGYKRTDVLSGTTRDKSLGHAVGESPFFCRGEGHTHSVARKRVDHSSLSSKQDPAASVSFSFADNDELMCSLQVMGLVRRRDVSALTRYLTG